MRGAFKGPRPGSRSGSGPLWASLQRHLEELVVVGEVAVLVVGGERSGRLKERAQFSGRFDVKRIGKRLTARPAAPADPDAAPECAETNALELVGDVDE